LVFRFEQEVCVLPVLVCCKLDKIETEAPVLPTLTRQLEIIRVVEQSHPPVKKMTDKLGVSRASFCRWR
jgi:hypothetical protein